MCTVVIWQSVQDIKKKLKLSSCSVTLKGDEGINAVNTHSQDASVYVCGRTLSLLSVCFSLSPSLKLIENLCMLVTDCNDRKACIEK